MENLNVQGRMHKVELVKREADSEVISVDGKDVRVEILGEFPRDPPVLLVKAGSRLIRISVIEKENQGQYSVRVNNRQLLVHVEEGAGQRASSGIQEGPILITAPMGGRISSIRARVGTTAEEGEPLLVLEAMKMENEIAAPRRGIVKEVYVQQGSLTKPGDRLVLIE